MSRRLDFRRMALLSVLSGLALQAPAQPQEDDFVVGVASHDLHRRDTRSDANALLKNAGIESVRTDAHWAFIERNRGQLKVESHWFPYLSGIEAQGMDHMLILGYGNIHYGKGEKPRSEPVRAAYNRYVTFLAQQLRGRIKHYEIWNEWDVENPTDPQFTQDYARLITDAAGIIRQLDPNAKVLAGAVTTRGIESGFALRLVEAGVMQSIDGLSLHPYVHCRGSEDRTPEAWIEWLANVDMELSRAAGQPVPLYLTEMAWPAHDGACGVSEDVQAAYLAQSFFLAKTLPNIKGYWWYDFRNDGTNKREREHNFGLLRQDYAIKPAYEVLAAINPIIQSHTFLGRPDDTDDSTVQLRFGSGGKELIVAWSTDRARPVTIVSSGQTAGILEVLDTARPNEGFIQDTTSLSCIAGKDQCTASIVLDMFPKIIRLSKPDQPKPAPTDTDHDS